MNKEQRDVATLRTTWNTTLQVYVVFFLNWIFDWDLTMDDLVPFAPVIALVIAILYRLSLVLQNKYKAFGWVLFGNGDIPTYK